MKKYSQNGYVVEMLITPDDSVRVRNVLTLLNNDQWVKGKLSENGTKLTLDTAQVVGFDDWDYVDLKLYRSQLAQQTVDGTTEYTYIPTQDPITFTITEDSIILDNSSDLSMGIGAFYADGSNKGEWAGYTDVQTHLGHTEFNLVTPPEGTDTLKYVLLSEKEYSDELNTKDIKFVTVGYNDNKVYIKGVSELLPDAWVYGNIDENEGEVTFPKDQVLGASYGNFFYILAGDTSITTSIYGPTLTYSLDGELVMDYNKEDKTLWFSKTLIINGNPGDYLNADVKYITPQLFAYTNTPATPNMPYLKSVMDYWKNYQIYYVAFVVSVFSTDSTILDESKLYYRIYLDDSPLTFSKEIYTSLAEDAQEIPIRYDDNVDFNINDNTVGVYIRQTGFSKLGVQLVYKDGDIVKEGEIAWKDVPTGISTVSKNSTEHPTIYDLQGRRYSSKDTLQPGMYIVNGKKVVIGR